MDQNFKCSGNCLSCSPAQRAYCSSQHAYSNMKVLDQMMGIVLGMQSDMRDLKGKIEAIQNNEAMVFEPDMAGTSDNGNNHEPNNSRVVPTDMPTETAQSGDGAESRGPETI